MELIYDETTDSLFIALSDRPYCESEEVAPGFVLDFDEDGKVIGIEHASEVVDLRKIQGKELPVGSFSIP